MQARMRGAVAGHKDKRKALVHSHQRGEDQPLGKVEAHTAFAEATEFPRRRPGGRGPAVEF
jgi:hypothetical protein